MFIQYIHVKLNSYTLLSKTAIQANLIQKCVDQYWTESFFYLLDPLNHFGLNSSQKHPAKTDYDFLH